MAAFFCIIVRGLKLVHMKKLMTVYAVFILLAGCTTNREEQGYFADFYNAWQEIKQQELVLNWTEAQQLPYATLRVNLAERSPALMPLGYLSPQQQKWYSKDSYGFTTENARITQIYNVDSEISSIKPSPLWQQLRLSSIKLNQSVTLPILIDYLSLKRIGVKASVTIHGDGYEIRQLFGQNVRLFRVSEQIVIPSMKYEYTNYYWRDPQSGFIWESIQKWGPDVPKIYYQVLKPWQAINRPF